MEPELQMAPIDSVVTVYQWPLWAMVLAGIVAVLLLVGLGVALGMWLRKAKAGPQFTPKQEALQGLAALRGHVQARDPHEFSIDVSDLLRVYVSKVYQLPATSQTSPEFLASAAANPRFSEGDRELLKAFLEKVDLIKFARLHASIADSDALLAQAYDFVNGEEGAR